MNACSGARRARRAEDRGAARARNGAGARASRARTLAAPPRGGGEKLPVRARGPACPHPLCRTLCFSNNSFDKCAAINRRIDDESADSIVLRCFLRDIVTVDLNFISEVQRKEEGGERRGREGEPARGRERVKGEKHE